MSPKTDWSFEVVFVIAPQKRRQGIDIDGSIPAGFFLSIFLLAIQASLLYLGWSVFHFRIFTLCQVINMKISPQWFSISRIHNNDLDQRHRFLWVSSSTCNLGFWKFTHANRCQLASETWGYRSDYSDNFYMNQDAEWHASSVFHFALLTTIRWFIEADICHTHKYIDGCKVYISYKQQVHPCSLYNNLPIAVHWGFQRRQVDGAEVGAAWCGAATECRNLPTDRGDRSAQSGCDLVC